MRTRRAEGGTARGRLERECRVFARHLTGIAATPAVVERYVAFHAGPRSSGFGAAGFDALLLGAARMGRAGAALADGYTSRLRRRSPLRRKLVLVLALLECSPEHARLLDAPRSGGPLPAALRLAAAGGLWALTVLAATLVFGPPHLVFALAPRAGRGGPDVDPVVVVGSGASGVHFALTALEKGRRVVMLDVGRPHPPAVLPDASFRRLKEEHDDPAAYLLGERFEALILPDTEEEYYGFPPSKSHVFEGLPPLRHAARGFAPLFSFARGGLAEAWTGGCYPFVEEELAPFPFGWKELGPCYDRVAGRIGVSGREDDLARFLPVHAGLQEPLELDAHGARLLAAYERRRDRLNDRLRCFVGRARVAVLSREHAGRPACSYLGRCLWGCPTGALYTPSLSLAACRAHEGFDYRPGLQVLRFRLGTGGSVRSVVTRRVGGDHEEEVAVGALVLAAGTLGSSRIVLESLQAEGGEAPELEGLMDNRQVLMPFVTPALLGRAWDPDSYQYHQLALGLDAGGRRGYVHGLITTLKTALIHPLVQSLPTSLGTATRAFRDLHGALGLLNVNFADWRRPGNRVAVEPAAGGSRLLVSYAPAADEGARVSDACRRLRRVLRRLGALAPRGMTHVRPMGASVHYAGTIPMAADAEEGRLTADATCRVRGFDNLWIVDGTTFPELPSKNLTFTLMANATRVAEAVL